MLPDFCGLVCNLYTVLPLETDGHIHLYCCLHILYNDHKRTKCIGHSAVKKKLQKKEINSVSLHLLISFIGLPLSFITLNVKSNLTHWQSNEKYQYNELFHELFYKRHHDCID